VDDLLARALDQLGPNASRVELALPNDVPVLEVDAIQVERALVNLLENSLKFSPQDEAVHIRVTTTRREVIVRIVDRGPGLPHSELERVFEPFHQAAAPEELRGTGLGLAIARGFAEANGGRVWAESHPGQGATFALALPLVEAPVGAEA
jgi:two-component system sensor histidine kinase KdpD